MIRWPGMRSYDKVDIRNWTPPASWVVVQRDWDVCCIWLAPRWIGWLYRLLPNHVNVNLTAWKTDPSRFLANLGAPSWNIGLLMNGRERNFPVPVIVLRLGTGCDHAYYLPWGVNLYCRMVNPSLMPRMFR